MPNNDNKYSAEQVSRLLLKETVPLKEENAELRARAEKAEATLRAIVVADHLGQATTLAQDALAGAPVLLEEEIARRAAEALRTRARYLAETGYTSEAVAQVRHNAFWLQSDEGLKTLKDKQ